MPQITYVGTDGAEHRVEVPVGLSLMEGAVQNLIPGIEAECGGACACSTCHVYVARDWFERLPPIEELEADMLDFAWEPSEHSRLACQVKITQDMEGLVVHMPERQI